MSNKLGPFRGINHRLPDFALTTKTRQGQESYLRDAVNVEIDNTGRLLRRKQAVLAQAMTGAHSLRLSGDSTGFLVRDSVLYAVTLPTYSEAIVKLLAANTPMSYVEQGGELFYSNGTDSGRLIAGAYYPLALPTPAAPAIAAIGGGLLPGYYQVAITYARYSGGTQTAATLLEESGASDKTQIELANMEGIRVTLPPATPAATHLNVYLTAANGAVPELAAVVPVGETLVDLVALHAAGTKPKTLTERNDEPLPAGRLLLSNGRLCSVSGNTLYIGSPYRYGYYDPIRGRIPFPADISIAVDVQAGMFVAADKTYWIPNEGQIADVLPYGAVPGTEFSYPDKTVCGWFGAKGIVLATPSGEVEAVMSDNVVLTPPASGFSAVFEEGEYRKVVSCGWCLNVTNKATTRYENWGFTSFSSGYGTLSDGIYALAAGGAVSWRVDFGRNNFGTDTLKHLPNAYVGVASYNTLELHVQVLGDYGGDYTYVARNFCEDMTVQRFDVGRGLRATWFALVLTGTNGTDFVLDYIDFPAAETKRRI